MTSGRLTRQLALLASGVAVVGMATLSACGSKQTPETPSSTTPPSQSESVTPTPTEKAAGPNGPNSFSPTVKAIPPNAVCQQVHGNDCYR